MAHKTWDLRQGDIIVVEPEPDGVTDLIVFVRNANNGDDLIAPIALNKPVNSLSESSETKNPLSAPKTIRSLSVNSGVLFMAS